MEKEIVVLTGGAGNIAQAVTRKYLNNDCIVISIDVLEENPNKEFYNNPNYEYFKVDVVNPDEIYSVAKIIEGKYGRITHLLSTFGRPVKGEIFVSTEELTIENIDRSLKFNLNSHIYFTKIFLPLLRKEKLSNRTVTYMSSINAIRNFDIPSYSAGKAGIYGFMYGISKEFGKYGIRVNTVSPGTVPVLGEDLPIKDAMVLEEKRKRLALDDFTTPEDIADGVYAVTHIMKAMVGQNVILDKGQSL